MLDPTWTLSLSGRTVECPTIVAEVVVGDDVGARVRSQEGALTVGTADGCALKLTDRSVSRFHLELSATPAGIRARDLGSTNGTRVGDVLVREVVLIRPTVLQVGRTTLRIDTAQRESSAISPAMAFGALVGGSAAMRSLFTKLEKVAPTNSSVLLLGESGTGKELAARAIHDASPRRAAPFEVVDCGGLPPTLIEAELFGHVRGSFTGATSDRQGAFERAHGGTLFLDELGELPIEVQPKLLRALGEGTVRPVGAKSSVDVDVRVVAATHRDLRQRINQGQFRSDLYYRLAVVELRLPPLRERIEDLPLLLSTLADKLASERGLRSAIDFDETFVATLGKHDFPGNVRELRNLVEQWLIFAEPPNLVSAETGDASGPADSFAQFLELPLRQAKAAAVEALERAYVERLLTTTGGNVAEAARISGVDRGTLFRMFRRHGGR
jgi:two-component system, NtrC family, response regulator GlrR